MENKCDVLILTIATNTCEAVKAYRLQLYFGLFGTFVLLETEMSIHSSGCVNLFSGNVHLLSAPYYILLCLTLDYFTHQGKNT